VILIFDLDDTLYSERTYVESGFAAVSDFLGDEFNLDKNECFNLMIKCLEENGRGKIFNEVLLKYNLFTKKLLKKCINKYRSHHPRIFLDESSHTFLANNARRSIYLVTDGNKNVQAKKISALNISQYFSKIFITHRYGIRNAKPSIYCFNLIKNLEKCTWEEMVYVGDNPKKDFVNLNTLGMKTIRVLTGEHKGIVVNEYFDAKATIHSIAELDSVLKKWE
jgi:putative hydrolase of the HAD superfamily